MAALVSARRRVALTAFMPVDINDLLVIFGFWFFFFFFFLL
jgi:hypothetical protein